MTDIYGALVEPGGNVMNAFFVSDYDSIPTRPKVCFGGDNYFVVWEDLRNCSRQGSPLDIYGARVTTEGRVLDPLGIPIFTRYNINEEYQDIAYDGRNYLIVCNVGGGLVCNVYGARVAQDGTVIDTNGFLIHHSRDQAIFPAVAFNGSKYLVAWREGPGSRAFICGAFVSPDASVSDTFRISFDPPYVGPSYRAPVIASNGNDFFVAWERDTAPTGRCFGTRVTNEGIALDTAGIPLGGRYPTALVFDGTHYVLLRGKGYKLNVSFITQQGAPLDTNGIEVLYSQYPVWNGVMAKGPSDQFLLAVANFTPEPYNTKRVYGAMFNRSAITEKKLNLYSPISFFLSPTIVKKFLSLQINLTKEEAVKIKIYDVSGRIASGFQYNLGKLSVGSHKFQLDLSALPNGVYFIIAEQKGEIGKIVITR
jgi:hypothetical protein